MHLSNLHLQILTILCWQCRCASVDQLVRATGSTAGQLSAAARTLNKARLTCTRSLAVCRLRLLHPLVAWQPGLAQVDLGHVAWQLEERWRKARPVPTQVVWATQHASRIVGGVAGGLRQLPQLNHDLGVAEVFVTYAMGSGGYEWLGEDAYRACRPKRKREKMPDAVLMTDHDDIARVIEFGGQYSRRRLEAFHCYWAIQKQTPYEIW